MDQPLLMCGCESFGDLTPDAQNLGHPQCSVAVEFLLQRLSDDTLHHEIWKSVFVDGVNRHHVRMTHGRGGLRLAPKTASRVRVGGQFGCEHLDGDDAIEVRVQAAQHDPHAAAADDFGDLVRPQRPQTARLVTGVKEIEWHLVSQWPFRSDRLAVGPDSGRFQEAAGIVVGVQQGFDTLPLRLVETRGIQKCPALVGIWLSQCGQKQTLD